MAIDATFVVMRKGESALDPEMQGRQQDLVLNDAKVFPLAVLVDAANTPEKWMGLVIAMRAVA